MRSINLNPKVIEKNKQKNDLDRILVSVFSIIVIITACICVPIMFLSAKESKKVVTLESEMKQYGALIKENKELQAKYESIKIYTEKIDILKENTKNTSELLTELNKLVPKDIKFENLTLSDDGDMSISGTAKSYQSIPDFLANLQMSEKYSKASIASIESDEESKEYSFSIDIEEVGKNEEQPAEEGQE